MRHIDDSALLLRQVKSLLLLSPGQPPLEDLQQICVR